MLRIVDIKKSEFRFNSKRSTPISVSFMILLTLLISCKVENQDPNTGRLKSETDSTTHIHNSKNKPKALTEAYDKNATPDKQISEEKENGQNVVQKELSQTHASNPKISKKAAKMTFTSTNIDFGFIDEGDTIIRKFEFNNEGDAPLRIRKVEVSCGCTIPVYPFTDIAPGENGHIEVNYNSIGKIGRQNVYIEVHTNAGSNPQKLHLKGVVR